MNDVTIGWPPAALPAFLNHLRAAPERVAFAAAKGSGTKLDITDYWLVEESNVDDGPWCVELNESARAKFFEWSSGTDDWIIEAHSHIGSLGDPAQFSSLDVHSLAEWVPHVRWRLGWRPYVALVVGPTSFDGMAWISPGRTAQPIQVQAMSAPQWSDRATQLTLRHLEETT